MNDPDYRAIIDEYAREPQHFADGAAVLDGATSFIRRYASVSDAQLAVLALWVVHTHLISELDCTPYLAITSAEKRSGKTRLLEVLEAIVAKPWLTGRVTAAVLTRKVDAEHPTLLLDESDAAFGSEKEYAEALRGVLNTGYRHGGKTSCCVGSGAEISFKDFSTFCAKAIAGIGKLPGTVADRSIPIRLKRTPTGTVQRFRKRDAEQAVDLRGAIEAFAASIGDAIAVAEPKLPEELSDRQQDAAECLVAIADLAGGSWPALARTSLVSLCVEAQDNDDSIGVRLLSDVRDIFEAKAVDRIASMELAKALAEIETSPWSEWSKGKPITPNKVAKLLKPYDIHPHPVRDEEEVFKGYKRVDFADAWSRYLPSPGLATVTAVTSFISKDLEPKQTVTQSAFVTAPKPNNPCEINNVTDVTVPKPPERTYVPDEALTGYTLLGTPGLDCTCNSCDGRFKTVAGWRAHVARGRCTPVAEAAE